ncbi:MAG: ATP synthase F1 subunit delta [Bacteroidetes bacterium]|nr:MAG: ATP synthase F1 subunit delta [Bacteroidota bacterium]
MVEDRIGYRYARSLFELANEKGVMPQAHADMLLLHQACRDSRDLTLFLQSPLVYATKKQQVLDKIFEGKLSSDFSKNLISIMVRKGREMYLPYVAKAFLELYDKANHIVRGLLTTAVPLEDADYQKIRKVIEEKTQASFEVETRTEPALIGGFTLKIGDQFFDGSVASAIRKIKRELLEQ